MKKIINGKRYDTNTAKALGSDSFSNRLDFGFWEETLYMKRTGEFFLHGEGGAMSRYAVSMGNNSWRGGESIIPVSGEEAMKWAEKHLSADKYEEIFGIPTEDGEKKNLCLSLDGSVIEAIRRKAAANGISLSDCVAEMFR